MVEEEEEFEVEEEIPLILDSYNDIFSDFDPRPYSEKALSIDFLQECKRAVLDKKDKFEIRLILPKEKRNLAHEAKIKKRLKSHFLKHYHEKRKEIQKIRGIGLLWFLIGVVIMFLATFLYSMEKEFIFRFLFIMAEPAGWFLFWEGLDKVFMETRREGPEHEFYKKMMRAKIVFTNY